MERRFRTTQGGRDLAQRFPGFEIYESAYVDDPCEIGVGTCVWRSCHVLAIAADYLGEIL